MAKPSRPKKHAKPRRSDASLPKGPDPLLKKHMDQALVRLQKLATQVEHAPEVDQNWHRKPTLTDEEWRDGVNKQLDALTLYSSLHTTQAYVGVLQARELMTAIAILSETLKRVIDTSSKMATSVHTIMGALDLLGRPAKTTALTKKTTSPATKWAVDYDKLFSRLLVVSRIVETVGAVFGHPKPPGE
jgi:hypothetical protein